VNNTHIRRHGGLLLISLLDDAEHFTMALPCLRLRPLA